MTKPELKLRSLAVEILVFQPQNSKIATWYWYCCEVLSEIPQILHALITLPEQSDHKYLSLSSVVQWSKQNIHDEAGDTSSFGPF